MSTATATKARAKAPAPAINYDQAEALFAELRSALVNTERIIIQIIETEAWRALGYASFPEAWQDRMSGVRLATEALKAHVVYAMLDTTEPEIISAQTGIHPELVQVLSRQKAAGIPAAVATVRRHLRRLPAAKAQTVHVPITEDEYVMWTAQCTLAGTHLADEAAALLRAHFAAE